jgi:hypothetical protein
MPICAQAAAAGHWPWTIDEGAVAAALVSPISAQRHRNVATAPCTYEIGSRLVATEVKLACGNDTNWLLFGADYVPKLWQVEHALTINIKEEAS